MMYTNRMTYFGSDLPYDVITNEVMVAWKTFEWRPVTALRISEHLQFEDDESDGITTVLDKVPVHVLRELSSAEPIQLDSDQICIVHLLVLCSESY